MRGIRTIFICFLMAFNLSCQSVVQVLFIPKTTWYRSLRNETFAEYETVTALEDPISCNGMAGPGLAGMGAHLQIVPVKLEDGSATLVLVKDWQKIKKGYRFQASTKSFKCSEELMLVIMKSDYVP